MMGANSLGSNSCVGKAMEKVSTRSELHLDKDDPTVDKNKQIVQGLGVFKASYKSTLLGASLEKEHNISRRNQLQQGLNWGAMGNFGRYLTVWPWSSDFSTSQSGIESQGKVCMTSDLCRFEEATSVQDLCLGVKTISPVVDSNCASPVIEKSGLE
ncbi:hypothetical protein J1N35_007116 [Gossypium stocksii]|uniref:Uncharacterized protein n=1 Tax=Gossypium stocksii TaxID=47602 RepID=A0A9D3W6V0_9ROSI|nr:hypothetical protein J1N35_007116 [Gossypium stocksii]